MKFMNWTNASARRPGDTSECAYGRKPFDAPASPPPPPRINVNQNLKDLLNVMKDEPKGLLQSKMLRASQVVTAEQIKKETEDILAVLRNLHKN